MTIEKEGSKYYFYCDICGEEAEELFFGFYEAVQYKKQNGWKSQNIRANGKMYARSVRRGEEYEL